MKRNHLFWINRITGALFIIGGLAFVFIGGPNGEILPISSTRASLTMRLALGITAAVFGALLLFGINDNQGD